MGLRLKKSITVFPGVKLNFAKSGVSCSFGGRGASVKVGARGASARVGARGVFSGIGLAGLTWLAERNGLLPKQVSEFFSGPFAELVEAVKNVLLKI